MSDSLVIPNDLEACQALIGTLAQTVTEQSETINEQSEAITILEQKNAEQKITITELLLGLFRRRSERYLEDPNQLKLDLGNTAEAADLVSGLADAIDEQKTTIPEHTRRRPSPERARHESLPEHLPRYEVEAEVPDDVKHCEQHGQRIRIGFDRIETLEFQRPKLQVRVTLIPKFACEDQPLCGVTEPQRPAGLVEGNRYDTSIAAEIITAKYAYHLPTYRQQDYFAGSGWMPGRSTLLNILKASAELIEPFIQYLSEQVRMSEILGTDETRVTLLLPPEIPAVQADDPKSRRIHDVFTAARAEGKPSVSARMWVYRSQLIPINVFDFTVSRHRDGPDDFLVDGNFTGTMMADCYAGFQKISLRSSARILRAACNAHARRKVFESRETYPLLSSQLLAMYQQLYDIEDRGRILPPTELQALRNREARPVWQAMDELLRSDAASGVLPKDKFAEALRYLRYLRNQWDALQVYLDDGRVPIDNNEVEQLMKQVALGRKNWLFVGSVAAGERAAALMSLVSSAVRNDLDVWAYVKGVLDQLLVGSTDYASLRPDRWAAEHPEHIRTYRQEERRDRADAKRHRRARRRRARSSSN